VDEKPCQEAYEICINAMNVWVQAANALQSYAATGPLDPGQDVEPIPFEEYQAASEKAEIAFKDYLEKQEAYFTCLEDIRIARKNSYNK